MHRPVARVGGSIMLTLPPPLLDILHLRSGAKVGLSVVNGRLIVEPQRRPHYTLEELLAECEPEAPITAQEREWLDEPPKGDEHI